MNITIKIRILQNLTKAIFGKKKVIEQKMCIFTFSAIFV